MPIRAYLWLKDDGGADIKGSVDVKDREGIVIEGVVTFIIYDARNDVFDDSPCM